MRAVILEELGGPQNFRVTSLPEPVAGPDEALVRVAATSLNRRDVFITRGLYREIRLPAVLGSDVSGTLEGKRVVVDPTIGWGPDESTWQPDATILGMPHPGGFAEMAAVPQGNIYPAPAHLSIEEAAALPLAGVTAYRALFSRGSLQAGEKVLITGVGGGVQTFALLFAVAAGANAVVTSGYAAKLERAEELGALGGVNYRDDPDWHKSLRKKWGEFDLVIDSAGGETFAKATTLVRRGGRIVTYGGTTGDTALRMFPIFWNQLNILGTSMGSPADFRSMLLFVTQHAIKPIIDRVYSLDEIPQAAMRLEAGDQFGKVVIRVS